MPDKKLILLIGLGLAAAGSLVYGILTPSSARRQFSSRPVTLENQAVPHAEADLFPKERHARKSQFGDWGRNPFVPWGTGAATSDLVLKGIAWDEENPKCVINGVIVEVGDEVAGKTVREIRRDRVILTDGEEELVLRV